VPYQSLRFRIQSAMEVEPAKSNRQIAKDLGISHMTVNRVRAADKAGVTVAQYRKAKKPDKKTNGTHRPLNYRDDEAANAYKIFMMRADLARESAVLPELGTYSGRITKEIIQAAEAAVTAWQRIVAELKGRS
jgi:DNA-binding Lrp family transcriptional regulator